ncbi:ribosome recycling factor [Rariglobus hedericola]|uniref:Ribosome-recycling factor n=1 Tax=Rariglobus hedericola TaxID=2597822 RepID=A0A556QEL3_9BACT|nr:ribosome recycling factor [Rariglobus hedericola]TSJ75093.1 ribosome recycling factor [Rariglobus hedericola]
MSHPVLNETQVKMKKAVDHTLHEFSNIHTGKANPSMVEGIMVEAYGAMVRIKDCAAISTPDARQILIQPWDKGLTQAISKAIMIANLGFNPAVDGQFVRIPLADMSRERRQEFVKVANRLAEEGRVHVRNVRRDGQDTIKKAKLPEDEVKRVEKELQTLTDKSIEEIAKHLASKEKDLLTV